VGLTAGTVVGAGLVVPLGWAAFVLERSDEPSDIGATAAALGEGFAAIFGFTVAVAIGGLVGFGVGRRVWISLVAPITGAVLLCAILIAVHSIVVEDALLLTVATFVAVLADLFLVAGGVTVAAAVRTSSAVRRGGAGGASG